MAILIRGGTLVGASGFRQADIRVEGERIAAVGPGLPEDGAAVLEAADRLVFPGFIDAHTHLDMDTGTCKTADDFASGTRGALAGGTTTVIDFATQSRGHTLGEGLEEWHAKAQGKAHCDYGFHMAITDWNEKTAAELPQMAKQGVTSFKVYMAYDNLRLPDGAICDLMRAVAGFGGVVSCHCENGDLVNRLIEKHRVAGELSPWYHPLSRPDYLEAEAVERFLTVAKAAEATPYVVHLSTALGLEAIRRARAAGQRVLAETCPQYLALEDTLYDRSDFEGAKYVCSPPLRKGADQRALWQALAAGELQVVATDHCSFHYATQKTLGREDFSKIPNGLPGIEHRPGLLHTLGVVSGRLSVNQMAAALSENPARIFGLYPRKGALEVGSDADIVLWDPGLRGRIAACSMEQAVDYTPYEGMEVTGGPETVLLRGEVAFQNGKVCGPARGAYLPRGASQWDAEDKA